MGTTLAIVAAVVLLLIAAYLLWTRRLERVRNAELTVKLVHAQAELIARRVQVEQLAGHKQVIPQPRPQARPKRERPPYLKPLAVVGGGVVTFAAWLRDHAAVTAALAAASAMLMLAPSVAPPPPSPPPFAEPDQGTSPPFRQEFPEEDRPPEPEPPPAPGPTEVPPTTQPPGEREQQPVPGTSPSPPTTPTTAPPDEPSTTPMPSEEPPSEEPPPDDPPCIVVEVPPEVNPGSCLDISLP